MHKIILLPRRMLVYLIRLYQKYISPCFPKHCKYYPTCSNYAIEAIKKHGSFHGTILSIKRILKCNPVSRGGIDLVPNNKIKRKVNKWKKF